MRVVKKPEERKAEMVAAASRLFAQQGFVRTSVAEIVSAVDVAKGLFYYYFTTKDDMVKAVVEGFTSYMGAEAYHIAAGQGTAREKVERLMNHEMFSRCFTEPLLADLCLPQHAALYSDMCDRVVDHMRPAVEVIVGQAMQERGMEMDAAQASRIAGVGMYGLLMMARRGEMSMRGAAEMFVRMTDAMIDA
ncbi:MAG: TetR/AcrR family transcriptional regulator [Clostridia bacterium]|nr:TetR/AcrR family transcriptional regulator [Clostridia bacterium]